MTKLVLQLDGRGPPQTRVPFRQSRAMDRSRRGPLILEGRTRSSVSRLTGSIPALSEYRHGPDKSVSPLPLLEGVG